MVNNLSIGRYINIRSTIHELDARIKLISLIVLITLLTHANTWQQYVALTSFTFLIIFLTRIPIMIFFKGIRHLLKIIIFTTILQLLFNGSGNSYFQWGFLNISEGGIIGAGIIFMRFVLILMIASAIGLSTKPFDLTAGLRYFLTPLERVGLQIQDFAFMMSISLRFIPTLFEEAQRLKKAQESRGVQFDEGGFIKRMRKLIPLMIPAMIGSFYRAQELADAVDARGYAGTIKRTTYKRMKFKINDLCFMLGLSILIVVCLIF